MRSITLAVTVGIAVFGLTACTQRNDDHPVKASSTPVTVDSLIDDVTQRINSTATGKVRFAMNGDKGVVHSGTGSFALGTSHGDTSDVTLTAADKTKTRVLSIGSTRYVQLPDQQRDASQQSKPWAKVPPGGNALLGGLSDGAAASGDSADPRNTLALLKKAGHIKASAPEDIDGDRTTRYTIEVDTKIALSERLKFVPAPQRDQFNDILDSLPASTTAQLWVNKDMLPVRIRTEMAATPLGKTTTQADYDAWGSTVTLEAPPSAQVQPQPLPSNLPSNQPSN